MSPAFRSIGLERFGLEWVWSKRPLAHPLPGREPPTSVYLAPSREPLEFTVTDGRAHVTVPEVRGHAMVVFEGSN